MSTYYKVAYKEDIASILKHGLRSSSYVWKTLKEARTFLSDESEDELLEGKAPIYRILAIDYKGRTVPDPDPDYPGLKELQARVLLKSVEPARIRLIGF